MSEDSGNPTIAPYGSWKSPIATEMLTAGALRFDELDVDGDDLYWVESRPDEQGRYAAMRYSADGELSEVTTSDYSARTLVHEYGGGSFAVSNGVDTSPTSATSESTVGRSMARMIRRR